MKKISFFLSILLLSSPAFAATSVPFTIAMSEAVNVTGSPRIAVDVGGVTRYADYASGTGTASLTFTYAMVAGDVDLDGVTLSSPIDLNGGTITDLNGNPETDLTFTVPDTSGIKIDYPSLSMDFVADDDGRYTLNGTAYNDLPSFLSAAGGTYTRNSVGTYYDASGTLQTASANQPRFDHDPVTHAAKGILIEESRKNILTYSDDFTNPIWTNSSIINADVMLSPDGAINADSIIVNTPSNDRKNQVAIAPASGAYVFSIYAKELSPSPGFALLIRNDTTATNLTSIGFTWTTINSSSNAIAVGNGWYRVFLIATTGILAGESIRIYIYADRPTNTPGQGNYFWGAQLEQGSFPTSYIPTTTAAVTRAVEQLQIPYGASFLSTKGTWYAEAYCSQNTFKHIIGTNLSDGYITYGNGCNALQTWDGVSNRQVTISPSSSGLVFGRYALGWDNSTMTSSLISNGGTLGSGSYSDGYSQTSSVIIGGSGGHALGNSVRKAKYYPARVSDTQLQLMTQ